jgi:hypothetical protein
MQMQRLVIDGSTSPDPDESFYESDPALGRYPPFAVFDVERQENLTGPLPTRQMAEDAMSVIATSGVLK